ncbi:MAG: hypothetical protein KDM64_13765, partial [Verrucomicrobiae bacterium]|nr:hypothetical protein [Verrucomicrobiae bacterium]
NATDDGLDGNLASINGVSLNPGSASSLSISNGDGNAAAIPDRKKTANSTFEAKLDTSSPMKRFHGYGTISFVGEPAVDIVIVQLGNPGLLGIDPEIIGPVPVNVGSATSNFLFQGHRVGMKVFGTQVSTQVTG